MKSHLGMIKERKNALDSRLPKAMKQVRSSYLAVMGRELGPRPLWNVS